MNFMDNKKVLERVSGLKQNTRGFTLFWIVLSVLGLALVLYDTFVTTIPPGHVGVAVSKWDGKVREIPMSVGWHLTGVGVSVKQYPTFTQTYVWTRSKTEGRAADESMNFQASSGVAINADLSISYSIDASKAYLLYQKYKRDYDEITHQVLRNAVRNSLNDYGTKYSAEDLLSGDKVKLAAEVLKHLNVEFKDVGITIEQFGFINEIRPPASIQDAVTSKVQMTQLAIQKEAELRKVNAENAIKLANAEAQAASEIKKAEGEATAMMKRAEGEAQALNMVGEAIRKNGSAAANLRVQSEWITKWNGELPKTSLSDKSSMLVPMPTGNQGVAEKGAK